MKNIKKFLLNIMNINEAKRKIEECLSKYPVDSEDDVFSKEDLILLISQMNIIVTANKKNNTVVTEDAECLEILKELLAKKLIVEYEKTKTL